MYYTLLNEFLRHNARLPENKKELAKFILFKK